MAAKIRQVNFAQPEATARCAENVIRMLRKNNRVVDIAVVIRQHDGVSMTITAGNSTKLLGLLSILKYDLLKKISEPQ